tara:strand:+ start:216892 stop:217842 length:951 start_codon:yes stop_codon:yes gene_type:complete
MERDISISSAKQVISALRYLGHDVHTVDLSLGFLSQAQEKQILDRKIKLKPPKIRKEDESIFYEFILRDSFLKFDLIFIALHGGIGENGTIQSILEKKSLPFTGSDSNSSSLAMSKDKSKKVFLSKKILTPSWQIFADNYDLHSDIDFPVIVKPDSQGSTVGLSYVDQKSAMKDAIDLAKIFDKKVIIEKYIAGRELTVGILCDKPLSVGEIIPKRGSIFDYESKYQPGFAEEVFPANISKNLEVKIKEIAKNVHDSLGLNNYSRVDFRVDADERIWCLEANTLPGLSDSSLLPKSALAVGISFNDLCNKIISKPL